MHKPHTCLPVRCLTKPTSWPFTHKAGRSHVLACCMLDMGLPAGGDPQQGQICVLQPPAWSNAYASALRRQLDIQVPHTDANDWWQCHIAVR